MLAAWVRARYPHLVQGAIAGSAPIYGIPTFSPGIKLDSSAVAISRGLTKAGGLDNDFCLANYEAAWVLVKWMAGGKKHEGKKGKVHEGHGKDEKVGVVDFNCFVGCNFSLVFFYSFVATHFSPYVPSLSLSLHPRTINPPISVLS